MGLWARFFGGQQRAITALQAQLAIANAQVECLTREKTELQAQLRRHRSKIAPAVEDGAPAPEEVPASACFDVGTGVGAYAIAIVGESRRQVVLRELAGDRRKRGEEVFFTAVLLPESDNPADPNAIKVHISGGAQVGYLSAEDAAEYFPVIERITDAQKIATCKGRLIGGTQGKWSIGVVLDLAAPSEIAQRVTLADQPF